MPQLAHLPIIAITASSSAEDQKNCLLAGMNDFISKPVVLGKLYATLNKWLQQTAAPIAGDSSENQKNSSSEQQVFDLNTLSRLLENDQGMIRKHAMRFLQTTEACLVEMYAELQESNLSALSALSHRIYSSALMVGAFEFAGLCQILEFLNPEADIAEAKMLLERLKISLLKTKSEMERTIS